MPDGTGAANRMPDTYALTIIRNDQHQNSPGAIGLVAASTRQPSAALGRHGRDRPLSEKAAGKGSCPLPSGWHQGTGTRLCDVASLLTDGVPR